MYNTTDVVVYSNLLPYYGYYYDWRFVMTNLSRGTREIWNTYQRQFKNLAKCHPMQIILIKKIQKIDIWELIKMTNKYYYYSFHLKIKSDDFEHFRKFYCQLDKEFYIQGRIFEGI